MIQVLIVEDSQIFRKVIENQIARSEQYALYASIENAANAEIACLRGKVDLILMDVCTADDESGLKAAAKIKQYNSKIKIIIMTSMPEHSFIQKAKKYGCDGFWYKEYEDNSLIEICDRVLNGEKVYPENTPIIRIGCADNREFTNREFQIIRELTKGRKYEDIAVELDISLNTVKYHIKNILQKTGFQNTLQVVAEVVERRLILPKY
ncbi:response regulator transcription factor [Bariatricus sp. SGI.161]|uniref:response regulator transcription factor n=1 Tax=Lachnospiraceae TaxID=186803 RepID=UPI002639900E|nr:response regulator transcription factor [uncultured Blautia sp.]MCI6121015.1 response regulator transcription factor [Lachnospiraceae bacterium]MCI6430219.1 response regulator transcription factor [Lachnospiraceae bacterium]MCI6534012.1 response regulator transcription factor [Lachnospiraceae bacterium]